MKPWFLLTIVSWCVVSSTADDTPLSFSAAREIILAHNAGLKAAQAEIAAADAGVAQTRSLPNPTLGVALDGFGVNEFEISVEQTFELGGKREVRTALARHELDGAHNAAALARVELEAQIARRFIPIAVSAQKMAVVDSILRLALQSRERIAQRIDAGGSKMSDLIRSEIAIEQLQQQRLVVERENHQARLVFAALAGEQAQALVHVVGELARDVALPSREDVQNALKNNPALAAYAIERARIESEREQLRSDAVPDVAVSLGYLRAPVDNTHSATLGLSVGVPLFNRNQAAGQQAQHRLEAAAQRQNNEERLLLAECESIYGHLELYERMLHSLVSSTIPKAQQVYAMVERYYTAGSVGFLDLAEAQEEVLRLNLEMVELAQQRALGLVELMQMSATTIQIVK
jgi:cobalt-zinc-cadmium efflux system outer membrane protein